MTKVTRTKRDVPFFRTNLKLAIKSKNLNQSEFARKELKMDPRTFNHICSGDVHPDLQCLHDIAHSDICLNRLFGSSGPKALSESAANLIKIEQICFDIVLRKNETEALRSLHEYFSNKLWEEYGKSYERNAFINSPRP